MKTVKIPFPGKYDYSKCCLIEAKLRSLSNVCSAFIGNGYLKLSLVKTDKASVAKTLLSASKILGGDLVRQQVAVVRNSKEQLSTKNVSENDINADFKAHRTQALISLGCFVFFEVMRRVSPTSFAATTLLRSAGVLLMSSQLLKSGIGEAIRDRKPNADTLTVTAVLASVAAGKPESSLTLLTLSNCAEMLTTLAAQKARNNITKLVALDVREVWVTGKDGIERKIPIEEVKVGMMVSVHTGEKICVDGTVVKGSAAVDQAAITGESVPANKKPGDKAYAGTVVSLGELQIKVEKVGDDTSLARIVHMVEDANNRRAPVQNYADNMATALVPVSFLSALVVYAVTRDIQRVLNLLFIDFSCGLKLSTATAISAAISRAAKSGILVKGGSFIEEAANIDTVVLDKTGTITKGKPAIVNITTADKVSADLVLRLAASAEEHSTHPMAISILEEVKKRKLEVPQHIDTETVVARGIRASIGKTDGFEGGEVLVGSKIFMQENKIDMQDLDPKKSGPTGSFIYVSGAGKLLGIVEIDDPVRDDFKRAVNRMRYNGIEEIMMLTGDNKDVAKAIATELGLDGYKAEVMPGDKASYVAKAQSIGNVLMVGDGINDAPALAYADIGVAMGTGCTDTAMETADVTINSEDPLKLPEFIGIGKKTMKLVHQNFNVTIAVNTVAMMLGALGFITPLWASVVHNASTIGVVLNSARVLMDDQKKRPSVSNEE
ncbi:MAG: cation-translocating P-type ATPase [Succinivibrio sp.]|nr:cation-translocating P-type ATPase [Succinivibrio sp.]